jgi:hypothetical protein
MGGARKGGGVGATTTGAEAGVGREGGGGTRAGGGCGGAAGALSR